MADRHPTGRGARVARCAVGSGDPAERKLSTPVRTCIGCRSRAAADELLRVVAGDGAVVADPQRRLPGRGAHLHATPECLAAALRRRAFPRALRVEGPLDVRALVELIDPA